MIHAPALLILPYFGSFGPWFPLFRYSLANQHTLDLLLLTDGAPPPLPANARRVDMTFDQLRDCANARPGTSVLLHRLRNICDLRPAYGLLFEEFTRGDGTGPLATRMSSTGTSTACSRRTWTGAWIRQSRHEWKERAPDGGEKCAADERAGDPRSGLQGRPRLARALGVRRNELAARPESSSFYAYRGKGRRRRERCQSGKASSAESTCRRQADGMSTTAADCMRTDGLELLYYHWGRMRSRNVKWPDAEAARHGFAFDRYGFYDPALGPARLVVRRGVGRVRELATDTRRRLSDAWVATRARMSGLPTHQAGN